MKLFVRWWEGIQDKEAGWESIDLIRYREHLVTVERRKPSTVNRRLNCLRRFCRWAKSEGMIDEDPSANVKKVSGRLEYPGAS